ncbi:ABC transporter substrate-binding protein [Aestuariispira insulae]|uniref:Extracellular solute-binding protein (Family 3) n=1 Tax=Aestuariispira insulae TaxID=1461337 RepID=A0A3D9HS82_9PROT|nr:ABC transporter substrate-binding protein [Aestuariispira insulae]RED52373.1 hypothetical protein DFP90_102394 [Aestuariispira insulae]
MQKPLLLILAIIAAAGLALNPVQAEEALIVRHYQAQERYAFGQDILDLALSKLNRPYRILTPETQIVNEKRGEMQIIEGRLDLEWMSTSREREESLIPVRIPIYRGLLGLRLILATKDGQAAIEQVSSLDALRDFTGGHGSHWGDLPVYAANGLKVWTNARYNTLFKQLIGGKFDYFHRGLIEIWEEQAKYADDLAIADNVMLFYPHPVYFLVSRHRPELAELLEQGLNKAIADGSYEKLFLDRFGPYIERANLAERRLIILQNPVVPPGTPAIDTSWWMPENHQTAMEAAHQPKN